MTRALMVVTGLALGAVTFGQSKVDDRVIEQTFPEGGLVTMHLASGDYAVRAGESDRIRVRWRADRAKHERDMDKIKVRTDLFGSVATIRTQGPTSDARFTIEVPARSDLHVRIRAGEVRIDGIEGNKDVRMTAGDLEIDVVPDSLRHVHASVSIGDLQARALGIDKSGFKNSLDWFGSGTYTLDARLFAGDVTLR
jgi:hypothetical protein